MATTLTWLGHAAFALEIAGKHVLIEKPLAASLAQADDLLATAKANGVILQVGHVERFNAAIRALHGLNPRPLFIEVHRLGPFSPRTADVGVVLYHQYAHGICGKYDRLPAHPSPCRDAALAMVAK